MHRRLRLSLSLYSIAAKSLIQPLLNKERSYLESFPFEWKMGSTELREPQIFNLKREPMYDNLWSFNIVNIPSVL